ncbi:MAG TPA: hypothetical protein PLQ31_12140, partial [Thermoanaerobaculia bacterium]|nr:hypothetical protein [Thermoanaerobaculia bacterium]
MKLGAAVVAALALLVLLGELAAWRRVREVERRVVQVAPTRRFAELERVRVPAELAVPVVPGRVLERLARDYDRPGLATVTAGGEVVEARGAVLPGGLAGAEVALGEFRLPRLPEGGGALVTREPGGEVSLVVKPEARRFVGLRSEWAAGALVAPGDPAGEWRGYLRWSGLRLGRVHVVAEAGA